MVYWVVTCFGGYAASIFRVEVHDYGDASTALLPTHRGS